MLNVVVAVAAAAACPAADPTADLLAIHEGARRAHLTGNADLMAASADAQVTMAEDGLLRTQTPDQIRSFFSGYFQRVRYNEWRDQAPPLVSVSPDGQIGWMAVSIEARYTSPGEPHAETSFKSSWIATYRKVGCAWKMTGMASNVVQ